MLVKALMAIATVLARGAGMLYVTLPLMCLPSPKSRGILYPLRSYTPPRTPSRLALACRTFLLLTQLCRLCCEFTFPDLTPLVLPSLGVFSLAGSFRCPFLLFVLSARFMLLGSFFTWVYFLLEPFLTPLCRRLFQ
jgi:hypothetical protein